MAAATASQEVEHNFTSVKLFTNEDVDHGTLLFGSRATKFLRRIGSPTVIEVQHDIGFDEN
ncbi:hypothetical protein PanWU01x14_145330 [Parasponia andersonii]|uniref:Uncharacterized protein n=1 Tax=Parasponia andersonii TaxID=3476 RepID=A0A2P5CK45_PARAD|nr:hypothetical protein PanWU01x14_145330 [Parasponia andersonii]